ncbi:MAG: ribonuclease III [Clostridia bacterium]|nr:ribonuclease III [Clostridia bacterium]
MLFLDTFKIGEKLPPNQYSALELAYIGDAIYEIYVRTMIIADTNCPMKKLHKEATNLVKAKAQADYFRAIEGILTEEEMAVFKRGRNTNSRPPKNADLIDYKIATGVEALIGYTYLKGDEDRLNVLLGYLKK